MRLLNLPLLTTALTGLFTGTMALPGKPHDITIQGNFTYGSGGTTADAWVQSSVDNGATFFDVCNFHFTTGSGIKQYNLFSGTPVTTARTPTNGSLAANTSLDGIFGPLWRVLYTTTGTYAGATSFFVDLACNLLNN